jgi:hypothetical protein
MSDAELVDRMLNAVSGYTDVGYTQVGDDLVGGDLVGMSDEEVGAAVKARMRMGARVAPQRVARAPGAPTGVPSPMFARSSRDTLRRAAGGFTQFTLAAAIGSTNTQSMKVSRVAHTDRLLVVPSGAGIVIDSIKVGDEEQLLTPGVPVELYGVNALTDTLPDNFSPLGSGIDLTITLRNTTAGALTALAGVKAGVGR